MKSGLPLRSAALMSKSWPPCRATTSPSIKGRTVQTSLRASSKGSNSDGKWRGARLRPGPPRRPCSLLGKGGTPLRSKVSGSTEAHRNGLESWEKWKIKKNNNTYIISVKLGNSFWGSHLVIWETDYSINCFNTSMELKQMPGSSHDAVKRPPRKFSRDQI